MLSERQENVGDPFQSVVTDFHVDDSAACRKWFQAASQQAFAFTALHPDVRQPDFQPAVIRNLCFFL